MEIVFTIEEMSGGNWMASCKDPILQAEGKTAEEVCRKMSSAIEEWFIKTFNTTRIVRVVLPVIKTKIKATVIVRSEKQLDEFEPVSEAIETEPVEKELMECEVCGVEVLLPVGTENPLCEACAYDQNVDAKSGEIVDESTSPVRPALPLPPIPEKSKVNGPCAYISDGKGLLPVGECEACSNEPSETPGIIVDSDGMCGGEFEKCTYYKAGGRRVTSIEEPEESYEEPELDEFGAPVDSYE